MGRSRSSVWMCTYPSVPPPSLVLAAALRAQGVPVTLKLYADCSHPDTVAALAMLLRGRAPTLADIRAFVSQGSV